MRTVYERVRAERHQVTVNPPPRWTVEIQDPGGKPLGVTHDAHAQWDPLHDALVIEARVRIDTAGLAGIVHAHPLNSDIIVVDLQIPDELQAADRLERGEVVADRYVVDFPNGGLRRRSLLEYSH